MANQLPDSIFNTLNLKVLDRSSLPPGDNECPICREQYSVQDIPVQLGGCAHIFGATCLRLWLGSAPPNSVNNPYICHLCREPFHGPETPTQEPGFDELNRALAAIQNEIYRLESQIDNLRAQQVDPQTRPSVQAMRMLDNIPRVGIRDGDLPEAPQALLGDNLPPVPENRRLLQVLFDTAEGLRVVAPTLAAVVCPRIFTQANQGSSPRADRRLPLDDIFSGRR